MTDRSEWSALARLAPSFTHEWSWAQVCAEQTRLLTFRRVDVSTAYLRTWVDDHLIGCPVLTLGDDRPRLLGLPRSRPALLSDPDGAPDPLAAFSAAHPDVELPDDPVAAKVTTAWRTLNRRTTHTSRSWGLDPAQLLQIRCRVAWPTEGDSRAWLGILARVWRGYWTAELVTHRNAGAVVGWSVHLHRPERAAELVAVLIVGQEATPWMSHHLRR